MRRTIAGVASAVMVLALASCGNGGSEPSTQDPKKAFCAGIGFDYSRLMELAAFGDGATEDVDGSRGFLKKLYTPAFVEGSPDEDLAQEVADGAEKAIDDQLTEAYLDGYVAQFNQLKAENQDEC